MSRPTRPSAKQSSYTNHREQHRSNDVEAAPTSALNKARAQFNEPLAQLQAIFPDWKEEDLLSVLEEVRGDIETAVARISEGHVEQWGSVKHKKEKKLPTHRERERDGQSHASLRGAASPRGRARGGRGAGVSRQQRDRASNHTPSTRAQDATYATDTDPQTETAHGDYSKSPYSNEQDTYQQSTSDPLTSTHDASTPEPTYTTPIQEVAASPAGPSRKPNKPTGGLSWAQVAKPHAKPPVSDTSALKPKEDHLIEMQPKQQFAREEPTTVETPSWDDEPVVNPVVLPTSAQEPFHNESAPSNHEGQELSSPPLAQVAETSPVVDIPARQPSPPKPVEPEKVEEVEPPRMEAALAPPPGLASPPLAASPSRSKTSTPTNARPAVGIHRTSSRFKSDQAVIMPNQVSNANFGTLPLQFGSLNISEESEQPSTEAPTETRPVEERPVAHPDVPPPTDLQIMDNVKTSIDSYASGSLQGHPETIAPVLTNESNGPVHTQAPPVDPTLAMAPTLNHPIAQQPPQPQHQIPSQHSLAGLTHTPQQSGQNAPIIQQSQPYGQASGLPSQGPYETGLGINTLSHLSQLSHSQSQAYFRQTDSPFYNQSHTHTQDTGFGGSNAAPGAFPQTAYSTSQNLNPEFGFDNQRNTFAGRGLLRHDEKGLTGPSNQHLGMHPGPAAQGQPGPNQGGGQGQTQYPGMAHLANPYYYNMNMNPYGYGNQFFSPAFTSFVNPVYQPSGNSTPPHGSKPSAPTSSAAGAPTVGQYSGGPGHLHHGSNGYDGEQPSNGSSTYHQGNSLSTDFSKSYQPSQGFLSSISSSGQGVRGPTSGPTAGGPSSTPSDQPFKGYSSGGMQGGLATPDKGMAPSRIPPGLGQNQPQFYGNRFQSSVQAPGFQNPNGQGPQQNDSYYGYQRW